MPDRSERERQSLDSRKQHQRETLDAWAENAGERDSRYRSYLARLYSPQSQRVRGLMLRLVLVSAAVFFVGVVVLVVARSAGVSPVQPGLNVLAVGVLMMAIGGGVLFTTLFFSLVIGLAGNVVAWWRSLSGR